MTYNLTKSVEILQRTPEVINVMLRDLSIEWTSKNEGLDTWSAYDIVGHLIYGEKTDWVLRMDIILSDNKDKSFEPFNRFAQLDESKGATLAELLDQFKKLRAENITKLLAHDLTDCDLAKTGIHPSFGKVSLSQLLAAWTVHDLNHIAQIARVIAKQYKNEVGPWTSYLGILQNRK